ncbi:MAG: amidohydrolase family protein [Desulfobacter sp.]|nr:amidohydrolase family protein [Desulfobacter sp.]
MKRLRAFFGLLALSLLLVMPAVAADYDLVINNGRVMDPETMYDAVANVGVKDGRIAVITQEKISGKSSIDATGLVVAPGFIDAHFHYTGIFGTKVALRDGRTTLMDLEIGTLGTKMDEWYQAREGKWPVNFGAASAHEFARSLVLDKFECIDTSVAQQSRAAGDGWSSKKPNLAEGNEILKVIDQGLAAGAVGVGSTLGYMRNGVSAREFFEIQHVAQRYGRQTGAHFRYTPGTEVTEANGIQEILANASALGAPALANHFNNPGYNLVQELLVRMRERGMNVWGEIYPYAAGSTALNAVFLEPEMWVDTLGYKYEETLQDVATGEFYTQQTREEMIKKEPTRVVLVYKMPVSAIVDWLRMPGVALCSDSMPLAPDNVTWESSYDEAPNSHPRFSGTFARAFRMSRENNIPLMQTIAMSSYNWVKPLGKTGLKAMQERGRMQEGMIADITIFDPEKITDNATYEKGIIPSTGIPYVLVNGNFAVKDSKVLLDAKPSGQPIRFEPVKSRFEPLSIEGWQKTYYAAPVDFGGGVPGFQPQKMDSSAMLPDTHDH